MAVKSSRRVGTREAARRQSSSLCERLRLGLGQTLLVARETFNFNSRRDARGLEARPQGEGATGV
jgi:hypothetical protein